MHYLALAIATLPATAILAVILWHSRSDRDESWLSQGRTASTQTRTRR